MNGDPSDGGHAPVPGEAEADDGAAQSIMEAVEQVFAGQEPSAGPRSATPDDPATLDEPGDSAPSPASPGGLLSPRPDRRRAALVDLAASGARPAHAPALTRLLGADPDPTNRMLAARALTTLAPLVRAETVRRALADPDDGVRAAAVDLAVARGTSSVALILPLVTDRTAPSAQQAAMQALAALLAEPGALSPDQLSGLLFALAHLDPATMPAERPGLAGLARAVGVPRLAAQLATDDQRRVGAVRLLDAEGSQTAMEALVGLAEDPSVEVRRAAVRASVMLGAAGGWGAEAPSVEPRGQGHDHDAPHEGADYEEVLAAMAAALGDPEEPVRAAAEEALAAVDRALLATWASKAVREGTGSTPVLAARVVQVRRLEEAAEPLLTRATRVSPEARGPYLSALGSLRLIPERLADAIREVDPSTRQEAVRLAWQVGGRGLLPHLGSLLQESAGAVRMAVLEVYAESGDPSGMRAAQQILQHDSSAAVRATAVHLLGSAPPEVRVAALGRSLLDPDPDVRATAVDVLPRGVEGEAAELLLRAVDDPDDQVWGGAVRHLAVLPERDLPKLWRAIAEAAPVKREELIRAIERTDRERLARLAQSNALNPDHLARSLAIDLAARAGTPECSELVVEAMTDPDYRVRRAAASSMSTLRAPAAVPALTRALSDPQPDVRVHVVRALGVIDDDEVLPLLISALKDPEVRVRDMAGEALTRWRSPAVARRLASALSSPDLRVPAGELLEQLGASAVDSLVEIVMTGDPDTVRAAAGVLEQVAGPQPFVARLSSLDPEDRLRAVEVLGAIGSSVAADGLRAALADPDERVRARTATLLGTLRDRRGVDALKRTFLNDPVAEVSAAAEAALRRLGVMPAEVERELAVGGDDEEDDESDPLGSAGLDLGFGEGMGGDVEGELGNGRLSTPEDEG